MNISTASALIGQHQALGLINRETAIRAQRQIREPRYYGNPMTGEDRRRIVNVRFGIVDAGIVDTVTPVADLLARAAAEAV